MSSEYVLTAEADGVLTITINRPEKLNALTSGMHVALDEAFTRFGQDDGLQVCVIRGAGDRAFCAGSDLTEFKAAGGKNYPDTGYAGIAERYDLSKPVIAVVDGICLGGGFELALAADIIVATPKAVFGLPEPKVGVIAIGGGIHRLARLAGIKRAMVPLLTGRNISADEGFAMGFISELVAADELDGAVDRLCAQILACAPLAVRLTKTLAMWSLDQPTLAGALAGQAQHPDYKHWQNAEDTREGPKAFAEKRRPVWKGR